jgi:hypothetical protein
MAIDKKSWSWIASFGAVALRRDTGYDFNIL